MRRLILTLLFLLFSVFCYANENEVDKFSLPPILMQSTFKIECQGTIGTCFILGHKSNANPSEAHFVLITAKHVLEGFKGDIADIHLRKRIGDQYERLIHKILIRKEGNPLWVSHPTADVAAIRPNIPKDSNIRSTNVISTALLADDDAIQKYEIQPGDELMTLGYPLGVESNGIGFPILRSGRIASFPLLPTEVTQTFLLDFEVFKGNSGGPVFLYDQNRYYGGKLHFGRIRYILGLVSRELDLTERVRSLEQITVKRHRLALAVIVHAKLIRETIDLLFPEEPIPEPNEKKDN